SAPGAEVETSEGNQEAGFEILIANRELQFANLQQSTGILKILKTVAVVQPLQFVVKPGCPIRIFVRKHPQRGLQNACDFIERELLFSDALRCTMCEVLDE